MICQKCGFKNPKGAKFCNQCGAELRIARRERDKGQRRRVAVLFADISGFTPLSENLDPEEVRDLIDDCLQRLAGVIYRYEGYIDKFIGDCVMALFGAPVTHEDDPLRAAISALDLLKEIKGFNKEKKFDLSLSVGVNYGLVATGDIGRPGEYTVMGDAVNLAQRLQYAAPRGKIYVSESIYENTKDEIVYKKLKKIRVKGKKEQILVYEPQRIKRQYSLRKIRELPLIGREDELKTLFDNFVRIKTGSGCVVSVVGEAGIGKSKLVYEFRRELKDDMYILEGRGIQYLSSSPYLVLKGIVKTLLEIKESDSDESAVKKVVDFINRTHYSSLLKIVPFLQYFLGLPLSRDDYNRFESMQPKDRVRLVNEALLTLLLRVSYIKPLVVIFEDCHWIDTETISFMSRLVEEIANKQIMVINMYRPEFKVIKKITNLNYYSQVNLKPLSNDDTVTLLYDLLNCKKIEERLVKLLMKKSGCIPFYIHELANNLINNKIIFVEDNLAKMKRGMESAVPRTLDELVMAKIDRLDSKLRKIVDIASAIGDEFSVRVLNILLRMDDGLKKGLSLLVQQGVLLPLKGVKGISSHDERYTFSHSLMREAIYQSLLKRLRKDYHEKIGFAIEEAHADNLREYYDALANHFLLGGQKAKAVEYLEKAGDRKKELYLNEEAIDLYQHALELIDKSQRIKIAEIYERLGKIYELIGKYEAALDAYSKMERYGSEDAILLVKSHVAVANVLKNQGLFDKALNLLDKSRKILKRMKEVTAPAVKIQLADILGIECVIYRIKGKIGEAEKKGSEAISLIKGVKDWEKYVDLKHSLAKAYGYFAIVCIVKGEFEKAIDLCKYNLKIAEELGDKQRSGVVYNTLGTIYRNQGKYDQAIDVYTTKLKISKELGDKNGVGIAYCNLGNVYQNKGEYEKAIELLENYLRITEDLGDKQGVSQAHVNLGIVYWNKGEYERSIRSFEKCLKISEELGDKRGIAVALGNLGEVYETKFEYAKAISLFDKYLAMSTELGDKRGIAMASSSLGSAHVEIGKLEKAEVYLKTAQRLYEEIGNKVAVGIVKNYFAHLRIKQDRLADARNDAKMALMLVKGTGATDIQIKALINMGKVSGASLDSKSLNESKGYFEEAVSQAKELKDRRLLADTYYEYAGVFLVGNKSAKSIARKSYRKALKIYRELNLRRRINEIEKIIKRG